jgi:hypothetical protein
LARKLKISGGSSLEYTIFGVSCHLRDYRFTLFLNEKLGFRLRRIDDFRIGEAEEALAYSFYIYPHPEERRNYFLVANFHESGRLIPEEKGADYFLIADDILPSSQKKRLMTRVQSISQVLAAYEIPSGKKKNLEVIFEEIELHLL